MAQIPHRQVHPIPPLFDAQSKTLILGSFPSVKSRETMFFYGHPQNRFWRTMAAVTGFPLPTTVAEKKELILQNHFALWDCIASCTISGSADSSIQDVTPNNLSVILDHAPISQIFCNGNTAFRCYHRYIQPLIGRSAVVLPSTSPANAAWTMERLIEAWSRALNETVV